MVFNRREYNQKYYRTHKEHFKKWYQKNKKHLNQLSKDWKKKHPGYEVEVNRRWRKKYPDKAKALSKRSAARAREFWLEAVQLLGGKCEACGVSLDEFILVLHHLKYGPKGKQKYGVKEIAEQVKKNPKNFALLCKRCHHIITIFQYRPDVKENIIRISSLTKPLL